MLSGNKRADEIRLYYRALFRAWGPQNWWPAESRFEVIVGAFLTQNTAWTNVEKALANLRSAHLLSLNGVHHAPLGALEQCIRPSGYFRQKTRRLKAFVEYVDRRYHGSLQKMLARPTLELREELLALNGIGPETADSILLYAGNHPVFVVDAYARRILERHAILLENAPYQEIRELFQNALAPLAEPAQSSEEIALSELPIDFSDAAHLPSRMSTAKRTALTQIFNEMHGLIVGVGKHHCKKSQPLCDGCPLQTFLPRLK